MNHVGWRYYPNPWRKFCDRWWWHWFDLLAAQSALIAKEAQP